MIDFDPTRAHSFEYRDNYTEEWEPCPSHVQTYQQAAKWYCLEVSDVGALGEQDISADFRDTHEPGYASLRYVVEATLEWNDD